MKCVTLSFNECIKPTETSLKWLQECENILNEIIEQTAIPEALLLSNKDIPMTATEVEMRIRQMFNGVKRSTPERKQNGTIQLPEGSD